MEKLAGRAQARRDHYRRIALNPEQLAEIREALVCDIREVARCLGEDVATMLAAIANDEIAIEVFEDRQGLRKLYLRYHDAWLIAPFIYLN